MVAKLMNDILQRYSLFSLLLFKKIIFNLYSRCFRFVVLNSYNSYIPTPSRKNSVIVSVNIYLKTMKLIKLVSLLISSNFNHYCVGHHGLIIKFNYDF